MKKTKVSSKPEPIKEETPAAVPGRDVRMDTLREVGYSPPIPKGFYDVPYPACNDKRWR